MRGVELLGKLLPVGERRTGVIFVVAHSWRVKSGCAADANISANVQGLFAQHPELEGPDQLYVKTIDHVVYLSGTVETGLHRDIAASVGREMSGVKSVVNNIAVDK